MTPSFLKSNLQSIKKTEQPSFKIANNYFNYRHHEVIDDILSDCSDGEIGREQVTAYFKSHHYYKGFFAAMIWGGGCRLEVLQGTISPSYWM